MEELKNIYNLESEKQITISSAYMHIDEFIRLCGRLMYTEKKNRGQYRSFGAPQPIVKLGDTSWLNLTHSFARGNDAKIVHSWDAQYKTKESDSLVLHCASLLRTIFASLPRSNERVYSGMQIDRENNDYTNALLSF